MNSSSKLNRVAAAHAEVLWFRRQSIRRSQRELRDGALEKCREPSTLATAALAGALLGYLNPPNPSSASGRLQKFAYALLSLSSAASGYQLRGNSAGPDGE